MEQLAAGERRKIIPRQEGVRTAAANELWECGHAKKKLRNRIIVGTLTNFFFQLAVG